MPKIDMTPALGKMRQAEKARVRKAKAKSKREALKRRKKNGGF